MGRMIRVNWWKSLLVGSTRLSRRQRRLLNSRRRRAVRQPVATAQRLETRTLLAAPNPLPLSSLNGANGFRLDGVAIYDGIGQTIDTAGDVNGDGFDDLLLGSRRSDQNGLYSGSTYVIFGKSGGFASAIHLSTLDGATGFRLDGPLIGDSAGNSVSGAGDVNGDGLDDLIIGAFGADLNGNPQSGSTYVLFGRSSGFVSAINLSSLNGPTGFRLDGVMQSDRAGAAVSGAGDVNGDGLSDLLIGADGSDSGYVIFGRSAGFPSGINLSTLDGTTGFRLDNAAVGVGIDKWVSDAGDVNGDGFDDLLIGADYAQPNGNNQAGSTYVLFGKSAGFASAIELSSLDGTSGFRLDGLSTGDRSGESVSRAGDVNGDGVDDLLVGASSSDPNGVTSAGSTYVLFGQTNSFASVINLSTLDGNNGFRLDGQAEFDDSGSSVSGAGDIDGDGFDDILISALGADPNGILNAGSSYVLFGRSVGFPSVVGLNLLNGTIGFRLDGVAEDDIAGTSVSGAGDVNGDGFDDLIIGARRADPNGITSAGSSYVIFGGNFTGGVETQVAGNGPQTLTAFRGAGAVDVLVGGRGDDTLISDGGPDVLRGGEGDDVLALVDVDFSGTRRLVGGTGVDTLRLDRSGLTLDLTAIADNRLLDIEQIDLGGLGNKLIFTPRELLRLSGSSNTLNVHGSSTDRVFLGGDGWTFQGIINIDGTNFDQYASGEATLNIESGIEAVFSFVLLSSLDGTTGFRLDGVAAGDRSARSVSSAGDVNGDGFEDFLIGADTTDPNGMDSGSTYVLFGSSGGFASVVNLSTLNGTNGFRLDGVAAGDQSGESVSGVGDLNGDGFADLFVGADFADPNMNLEAGSSYVLFGHSGPFASVVDLSTLDGTTGFRLDGIAADDRSGISVSGAGDVNGDGLEDVILGAFRASPGGVMQAGSSFVLFGQSAGFASAVNLSTLDGTTGFRLNGEAIDDYAGFSVGTAGDLNGDGLDDVIIGAWGADSNGSNSGSTYIVFGSTEVFASVIDLSALDGTTGFRLDGTAPAYNSGRSVSSAGDVNGDGIDDAIIGAFNAAPNGVAASGSSYVLFGRTSGFASVIALSALNGATGFRIDGSAQSERSGYSVSGAGDVNGDGFNDVVIGAQYADSGGINNAGSTYVVYGRSAPFASALNLSSLTGNNGFRLDGVAVDDRSGNAVSGAGDVNGDGFDDLLIAAQYADPNGMSSGSTYLLFGGNFTGGGETQIGGDGGQILTANQGAGTVDILIGGRGDDTLTSDGGPDILRGGEGDDLLEIVDADFSSTRRLVGGTGIDTVKLNGVGITLDLPELEDNRLVDIERIELGGTGNRLIVSPRDLLRLSGTSNTLTVRGGSFDLIVVQGEGWSPQGTVNIDGTDFRQSTNDEVTLNIETTLDSVFAVVNLSTLDGTTGFRLDGAAADDYSGISVSGAGDVNGDGFDDLLVGAFGADPNGNESGSTYVLYGRSGGFSSLIDLSSIDGINGFRIDGALAGDESGVDVTAIGDINGDGLDDLLIGAHQTDSTGIDTGTSYVLYGQAVGIPFVVELSTLTGVSGYRLNGTGVDDRSGNPVGGAGDINGDGYDDFIIGAFDADPNGNSESGSTYVVFGNPLTLSSTVDLSSLGGTDGFRIDGVDAGDKAGFSVSGAGDMNGDGFDDLILGARQADPQGRMDAGESYVLFGHSGGFASVVNLSSLDGTNGFRIDGAAASDDSGQAVTGLGDINGDGFDDVLVGARFAVADGNTQSGASYVIFGRSAGFGSAIDLLFLDETTGFRLDGAAMDDQSGRSLGPAGDVNGDGFDDLFIGAPIAAPNGAASGSTYLIFGRTGGFGSAIDLSTIDGTNGFRLDGVAAGDWAGFALSGAFDVNGDGFDDLIIGAQHADPNGNSSGSSYVFFGDDFSGGIETQVGGDGSQTLNATQGASVDVLIGGRGDDTLVSDGGDDVLRGGEGDDVLAIPDTTFSPRRLQGGNGLDTLRLDGGRLVLDLIDLPDNRIVDVEAIDLSGSGSNLLIVNPQEVLNLSSSSNTLTVRGGGDDRIFIAGEGWIPNGTVNINAVTFERFVNGAAQLNVQVGLQKQFVVVNLSTLDGINGFRLDGVAADDLSGFAVSGAGDVNGDGFEDLIVGAPEADPGGDRSGATYVVFGRSGGFSSAIDLSSLDGTNGFRLDGVTADDESGTSVSGAGDVNGDGLADLIIGAYGANPIGDDSGSSYVIFGRTGGFPAAMSLSTLDGTNGFRIDGEAIDDESGFAVSGGGDVNGDGLADLIIGARDADPGGNSNAGRSYVVFGRSTSFPAVIKLSGLTGLTGFRLDGALAADHSGRAVSMAGDVNGDGLEDLIVGAYGASPNGAVSGMTYVVFGRTGGMPVDLQLLDGNDGFRLEGVAMLDASGSSVSRAGDLNGDGFDDLIIGAQFADPNGNESGSSYVFFGRSGGFASAVNLSALDGVNGFRIDGAAMDDQAGGSVSAAGDVNGDGFDDLIIGAHAASPNGLYSGSAYVVLGRSSGFDSVIDLGFLNGKEILRFDGAVAGDLAGTSVSGAGDVNGDGFDDIIIGAALADPNGNYSGSSYVYFGGNFTGGGETQVTGDTNDDVSADQGPANRDILISGRAGDTLTADGGPDVLRGGEGDDILAIPDVDFSGTRRIVGGTGTDTLRLDDGTLTLDLATIPDNWIVGVEAIDLRAEGDATLIFDVQEVLSLSETSNTLTIFANGDTIDRGVGWIQQADEVDSEGFLFEVFTQGAATLRITQGTLVVDLPDGGSNDITIRRNDPFVEVFDNVAQVLIRRIPLLLVRSIVILGGPSADNHLTVDYDFGGFFEVPRQILFTGGVSGIDELDVVGTGSTLVALTPASGTLAAGRLRTEDAGATTDITYTQVEPVGATDLLSFRVLGALDVAAETLTVEATAFALFGFVTTLDGGTIDVTNGLFLDGGRLLQGTGLVDGRVAADSGSQISATGSMTVGDPASLVGFSSDGELHTNDHTVTLADANEAVLGSLTVLGTGGMSGTLTAANGFLLEEGKNLTGQGTVNGEFHNDGHVAGTGTGIVFSDLVTGIGSATNVTYNGGFSPGHSPAEVDLAGIANLASTNTLFIELGGLTPGGQFDRLASTGTVNVDGTLEVSFIDGFVPASGHSFEIIGADAVNGTFDAVNLPTLPLGLDWDVVYAADSVTLNVFALPTFLTTAAINGGLPNQNRSGIGTLGLTFDLPVNVAGVTTLTLFNHTIGMPVDISTASLGGNGSPVVTWNLASLSLPDGRYTAELIRSQVNTTVGGPLARAFAFEFHVLGGDLDGDGFVNFNDTVPLSLNFGQTGGPTYGPGDGDGDGFVNFNDTVPLSLNFGASLAPLTYDFGDAPETGTSFATTLASNGARHVITGNTLFLGADRDAESDGQPNADATGDGADENGLVFAPILRGTNANVTVTSSGAGFLNGWIDFNQDGDWDDAGEQVFTDQPVVGGPTNLQIAVPAGATLGSTLARFRLTGSAGYSYFGLAPNGEVEDYRLSITDPAPDLPETVTDESLRAPAKPSSPTIPATTKWPDWIVSVLIPTFTTFDSEWSLFPTDKKTRSRLR